MALKRDHGMGHRTAPMIPSAIGAAAATAPQGTPIFFPQDAHATEASGASFSLCQSVMADCRQ
jgi:hypothetical protein